jgi:hypothetical protein
MATSTRDFLRTLPLPELPPQFEAAEATPVTFSADRQAIAIGSQLAEFTPAVSPDTRNAVANTLLLAQLAANKAASQATDVFTWYNTFTGVLGSIGWQSQGIEFQVHTITDRDLDVHKAIIPVITAMLGPAIAAASLVVEILKGLESMNSSSPWITLFSSQSKTVTGAKFQLTYVDADTPGGDPKISLVCFTIKADGAIDQVLFFKFTSQTVELKKGSASLSATTQRLNTDKDAIAARVNAYISSNVQNIAI